MAMHNTNRILKYAVPGIIFIVFLLFLIKACHHSEPLHPKIVSHTLNTAAHDSAAESLDTLTAELAETREQIKEVAKTNATLNHENTDLRNQVTSKKEPITQTFSDELETLKTQVQTFLAHTPLTPMANVTKITDDGASSAAFPDKTTMQKNEMIQKTLPEPSLKPHPYYTIPANGTSVKDHLMTALVGRIPVKGVVTDPYPFKIVISDDNLAANGLRIPHLMQMIVSGYCEGDLNLVSVRGWITSLTFVFEDGTISTTTSNDNDIGNFTKANSLGYLSDAYGNPFIRGRLISNAPAYLAGNVALSAATGAASAYAAAQTTSHESLLGNTATSITGSEGQFLKGQAVANATQEARAWWHDREEQSFDAIYVAPLDDQSHFVEIAVNFAKEIHIDYDPQGRKLNYAHDTDSSVRSTLD